MVVGATVDAVVWFEDVGEGIVYTVVVATIAGGGPKPGGGGAPGGGGGRPPAGGGGGSCPSKIAVNEGGTIPTKEHSPVNQFDAACRSVDVQFALKHGTAFAKNPSPGPQTQFHCLVSTCVLKGGRTCAVVVPVDGHPISVKTSSAQVDAQAGMPLEASKSCEATWTERNKKAQTKEKCIPVQNSLLRCS